MGEKIKPMFKIGFDLPAEGLYLLRVEETSIEPSQDSEKMFKVRSVIEGTEEDGKFVFDNFPLVSKNYFGLRRLTGFLIKLQVFEEREEYDSDIFRKAKFEEKWGLLPGKKFGGRIKHVKSERAKSTEGVMANIVEYLTEKELQKVLKSESKESPGAKPEKAEQKKEEDQDWI